MKKPIFNLFKVLILILGLSGCDSDKTVDPIETYDYTNIINSYSDNVIIATYSDLKIKTADLQIACDSFANNPTQPNLNLAANAWYAARAPWELSEAFLFGPVSFLSIDPSMDSWPVDETQLESVLSSTFELTPDFVRNGLGYSLRGFHTLEYFLFTDGSFRDFSNITERGRLYMTSVATVLAEDAVNVHDQWVSSYGAEFKNAGKSGSRYSSVNQAVQEIADGIITIVDEVGNGKISEPFVTKDVNTVESQYSWNSLTDFSNNITGVKNAYLGGTGTGLDEYVKSKNSPLNDRVLSEIEDAITKISSIPEPFRNNLNANTEIQASIDACNTLLETFINDVKPLLSE
jgi:uncharacterized iron-regulated protein